MNPNPSSRRRQRDRRRATLATAAATASMLMGTLITVSATASPASALAAGRLQWPVTGRIWSCICYRTFDNSYHQGLDLEAALGTPVHAAASGTVLSAQPAGDAGNMVKIDHGNGWVTKYMHLSSFGTAAGQRVTAGQVIGLSGSTGHSTGPHLHFQVDRNGAFVDYDNAIPGPVREGEVIPYVFDGLPGDAPPPPPDTDGDGVPDNRDNCRDLPGTAGVTDGCVGSAVSLTRLASGAFMAFGRGTDGKVFTDWQASAGSGWSGPRTLSSVPVAGVPVAEKAVTGGYMVFATKPDGTVWDNWQNGLGTDWTHEETLSLAGTIVPGTLSVVRQDSGALMLFGRRRSDDRPVTAWQPTAGSGWQGWTPIGAAAITGSPVVEKAVTGGYIVFATKPDGSLWHNWQTLPGNNWNNEQVLPFSGTIAPDSLTVVRQDNGALMLFGRRSSDNRAVTAWQTGPGTGWLGWTQIGDVAPEITGTPRVQKAVTGGYALFARTPTGQVSHSWQAGANQSWQPWAALPTGAITQDSLGVARNAVGVLMVFGRLANGGLTHDYQTAPGAGWKPVWEPLPGTLA